MAIRNTDTAGCEETRQPIFGAPPPTDLLPFRHAGALFHHVVPAIVMLRADALQNVVLETVADFLRYPRLAGQNLEGAAEVAIGRMTAPVNPRERCIQVEQPRVTL